MTEIEQAEAALAALIEAEREEADILAAERQAAEAEAALAEIDTETELGTPMFDNEELQARLDELTITPDTVINIAGTSTTVSEDALHRITDTTTTFTTGDLRLSDLEEVAVETEKFDSSIFDEAGFLTIEKIKMELFPILDDLYSDRWDWDSKDRIRIHFPAFTITNSKGERHDIKDLYVELKYNHSIKVFNGSYKGARGSVTKSELNGAYAHSHLPSISRENVGKFNSFCLGSSTLSYLLSDLATLDMTPAKLEDIKLKFMIVLMEIENYLQWESLEGGPYRRMSNINSGTLTLLMSRDIRLISEKIVSPIYYDINANTYKPQIKFNHKGLLEVIKNDNFLVKVSSYCATAYLTYRDASGKFYSERKDKREQLGKINSNNFKFKGKTIFPQLIDDVVEYEESGKDFAHPKIVDWCKKHIELAINKSWGQELSGKIVSHYLSRQRKVAHSRKSLFTNLENVRDSIET